MADGLGDTWTTLNRKVQGDTRHDDPDGGRPAKIGGAASSAAPTSVGEGDRVNAWFDLEGRQAVLVDKTVTITATALDIRPLSAATDEVATRIQGQRDDVGTALAGEDAYQFCRITQHRALHANLRQEGGSEIGVSGNPLRTDPTGTTAQPVSQSTPANLQGRMEGTEAHDSSTLPRPVLRGAKAVAHGSNPTAVAADDLTHLHANRHGIPYSIGGHPNVITEEFHFTTAQTNAALVTVGVGTKIVVTAIDATLDHATSVDVGVRVGFAVATLTAASSSGVTGIVLSHPGLAAGSGLARGNGSGIIGVGADNEDLRITSEVPTDGALRVTVTYFTIES